MEKWMAVFMSNTVYVREYDEDDFETFVSEGTPVLVASDREAVEETLTEWSIAYQVVI